MQQIERDCFSVAKRRSIYIYDVSISGFTRSSIYIYIYIYIHIYIYDISSLRVKYQAVVKTGGLIKYQAVVKTGGLIKYQAVVKTGGLIKLRAPLKTINR